VIVSMVDGAMELLVWLRKTKKTAKDKNKTENKDPFLIPKRPSQGGGEPSLESRR
jgi:hypothetical protein